MLSDRTKDALDGIRLNLEAIADFTSGLSLEQFLNDRLTFYAVTRALEIISEASRRLPDDLKARHPTVRWRAIHDAGNVYRHAYGKVSRADVWDTATMQLEELRNVVAQELGGPEKPAPGAFHAVERDEGSKE